MDFYHVRSKEEKDGSLTVRPDWKVGRSKDLMTRGGSFYAIWDDFRGLWSTDIYDVQRLVDEHLRNVAEEGERTSNLFHKAATLENNSSGLWDQFQHFLRNSGSNYHNLDENLVFANSEVRKEDYASKRLSYSLSQGSHPAWDTIVGTLFNEEERAKIEWTIGAVVSGDSKIIQKFLVFYGPPGSGKSTILNIIQKLFDGYTAVFDARELAGQNNSFATAAFKSNPLVAIQHDGDLSRIYDNTKLNSIVAHETLTVNEKYKTPFEAKSNAFLFMGTNLPVKISDAKAGIIRRLIDVVPTQKTIEHDIYHRLMEQINFELGAIAKHCLDRYKLMGKNFYSGYRPTEMMLQTDVFFNFVESVYDVFKAQDGVSLGQAWNLYKEYCAESGIDKVLPKYKIREELKNYFHHFDERIRIDDVQVRSYYRGFKHLSTIATETPIKPEGVYEIVLEERTSVFDELYPGLPAQYANDEGFPDSSWSQVKTTLIDIDTTKLHWVKVPEHHIVIDFDLLDDTGNKNIDSNIMEASRWPATYTEISKSGHGIHLHYMYSGDPRELASVYDVGVEIKTLLGDSSLRRKLTKCNDMNITVLEGGLPKKEKQPVLTDRSIKSEKGLREMIARNLRKEFHAGTKPSIDFIHHVLEEAYVSGMSYDVTDMKSNILTFALKSTNQSTACIKQVQTMQFVGQREMEEAQEVVNDELVFFDVEVYPNLLVVCWMREGSDQVARMINPTAAEIEPMFKMKLVGFNNRRYDNHVLYARYLGYSVEAIYEWSKKVTSKEDSKGDMFGEAYNLSYTDIYDFSSKKQGLKQFQIDLKIFHMELDLAWDQPVPEDMWARVVEYCVNDVISTREVFHSRKQDFVARQILASISGLSVNHSTQTHTAKIIFGDERKPQSSFKYTDLSEMFPGYEFNGKDSTYRGEITGEGGLVYAEPGAYECVALLDVASMHPTSIVQLEAFGPYTQKFKELLDARLAIKAQDFDKASDMLGGKLAPFLVRPHEGYDIQAANDLSYALKIVINTVYGLTSARFDNPFKDWRNKDNIVAKRGALFMIDLKYAVQEKGFVVAHIKTDSIKIPNATPEIISFVTEFGKRYGYDFEHEVTYEKFCLINDAVYIAAKDGKWTAVGAQFQHPYVYKTLFTDESPGFDDLCESKNVKQGTMYLDFSGSGDITRMGHVGRTGSFVPVETDGGDLWRVKEDKLYAVTGTKGRKWITRDVAVNRFNDDKLEVDTSYFEELVTKAIEAIGKFTEDVKQFIS